MRYIDRRLSTSDLFIGVDVVVQLRLDGSDSILQIKDSIIVSDAKNELIASDWVDAMEKTLPAWVKGYSPAEGAGIVAGARWIGVSANIDNATKHLCHARETRRISAFHI